MTYDKSPDRDSTIAEFETGESMREPHVASEAAILQDLLGYLNLSSGASDPQFLGNLDCLYRQIEAENGEQEDTWLKVCDRLQARLRELTGTTGAFHDSEQALSVIELVCKHFVSAYREFHIDLLAGQTNAMLLRPYFLGRFFEAVLQQGPPWSETERIVTEAQKQLDDFIGHRPVAVLRTAQRIEPYEHEWVRPIPVYVRSAGVGTGRYQLLIAKALDILRSTAPAISSEAYFNLDLLDELAIDPRQYDFDHPANKRPNYHFGGWDPHNIDNHGHYRRFVLQQVTLDALLARVMEPSDLDREERLFEAAAVLAGTILMASGISGSGPDTHSSTTTLGILVPRIAAYRDAFYEQLLAQVPGHHGERLREEASSRKQPLAGARQHLNHYLARRRATQLQHVHLALLFAEMGYAEASERQADVVFTASARIHCQVECRIRGAQLAIDRGDLHYAADLLVEIDELIHRGIGCGALVDPWNILGFQGNFSLFPAPENSVPDHRIHRLVDLLGKNFSLDARLWREAAACNDSDLQAVVSRQMSKLANWWDQFAATSVEGIEAFSGQEAFESAGSVAQALSAWHRGGASSGDIAFWREHVEHFNSSKAYALVVDALLDHRDFVGAMALLLQWLSQASKLPLEQGEFSFHILARRWLDDVMAAMDSTRSSEETLQHRQSQVQKFFDFLEANAEDFWQVPELELNESRHSRKRREPPDSADEDSDSSDSEMYSAAYDEMVYVDSTADGIDADMLESEGFGRGTDYELELESRRVRQRLGFLATVSSMWRAAALSCGTPTTEAPLADETLSRWLDQANQNHERLLALLATIDLQPVETTSASRDALLEYDRRRAIKEVLLDAAIGTLVDTADAQQVLRSLLQPANQPSETGPIDVLCRAVLAGEPAEARRRWPGFLVTVEKLPLLYVSLARGGNSRQIAVARSLQRLLRDLVRALPKLGLLRETCQLLETARLMENSRSFSAGSVSEFDRLFETGYKAIVESLVDVSRAWLVPATDLSKCHELADSELVDTLEQLTETLLKQWLAHSRTLRLSALEKVGDEKSWQALVVFIQSFGRDLLTQRFLNLGNLRAILHQGVENWLTNLEANPEAAEELTLVAELEKGIKRSEAVKHLTVIFEAIVENYAEYRDYNSTTTQSDRGEMLYTLLDFLRLRVQYDRIAWHLRPVVLAHEILVRRGRLEAAEMWRRAMAERTAEVADALEQRLAELRKTYAMRLPTVDDRLGERFIRPLAIDRVRALVASAVEDARIGRLSESFERLESETEELAQEPTGAGLDLPGWLHALEDEVQQAICRSEGQQLEKTIPWSIQQRPLSITEVSDQLTDWEREPL